ncbi:hypothetical protein [Plantactinospora soyae]|uniref:Ternary complex associated domain-containing protein n=1 Tax=Plantactinospora soyae TaxID=1544732 RepID=A0A927M6L6_9ACTN|nr:hypothetical protein [Plantactinospora soyae]MBE1487566.1 hypothetical protein [Plantactinospora soyae]
MEVGFTAPDVPDEQRPELEEVLRGIAVDPPGAEDGSPGRWRGQVDRINVLRRLPGGRSGAEVFDVAVERRGPGRRERCVVKVDRVSAIGAEWAAIRTYLKNQSQAILTPVDAVSESVLDGPRDGLAGTGRAAIVYRHVADWAGLPDGTPETLESMARAALLRCNSGPVVRRLEALLSRVATALHAECEVVEGARTLESLNPSLGVDLVLEVDRVHPEGYPSHGIPLPDAVEELRRYPRDVLYAATWLPSDPEGRARISVDDTVALRELHISVRDDERVLGRAQNTTVELRPARTHDLLGALRRFADERIPVIGRVLATRAGTHWATITRFLPDTRDGGRDGVTVDDVLLGHPFAVLRQILTTDVRSRVRALVHGDLNPRNVLLLDDQLFLIDFAGVAPEQPVLSDPAWLEVCLLREVIAPRLAWPALVRLQRLLATAVRLHPLTAEAGDLVITGVDDPVLRTSFEMLWTIRRLAYANYPETDRDGGFRRDYLEQLTLAACRTLKWPDADQDEDKIRAAVAAAGVATEWLDEQGPYRHWSQAELEGLALAAWARLDPATDIAGVVAEALRALDRHENLSDDVRGVVDDVRVRVVTAAFLPAAQNIVLGEQDRSAYIRLDAYLESRGSTPSGVQSGVRGDALDLIADLPEVAVVGDPGAGKSTLVHELRIRLARAVCAAGRDDVFAVDPPARFPVLVSAGDIAQAQATLLVGEPESGTGHSPARVLGLAAGLAIDDGHLRLGTVHVTVDGFNELADDGRPSVVGWVSALRGSYPRTPVVVCHRSLGFSSDLFGFPVAELQDVTEGKAHEYIIDSLRATFGPAGYEKADRLSRLLRRPQNRQMWELARNPLFLWLLVEYYVSPDAVNGTLPENVGMLFGHFAGRLLTLGDAAGTGADGHPGHFTLQLKEAALEALGEALVERHNVTDMPRDEAQRLLAGVVGASDAPRLLQALLDSDLLCSDGGHVRFRRLLFQEYYAARVLAGRTHDADLLRERTLQFKWREPLRLMLGSSGDQPERTRQVIDLAQNVDAVFAAQLLRACEIPPQDALDRFIATQRALLRSPALGEASWEAAARGLVELDSAVSWDALRAVADDPDVVPAARGIAVAALVRRALRSDATSEKPDEFNRGLSETLVGLLRPDVPRTLRRQAVEAVGEVRLVTPGLTIGDLIDAAYPWDIVDAAYQALRRLGITPGEAREQEYLTASEARLAVVEVMLRETADRTRIGRLDAERLAHLERMFAAGRLDSLLPRRFSFGIAEDIFWSMWLEPSPAWIVPAEMAGAREVLQADLDGPELLRRYTEGDDWTAVAAVHRILERHPDRCAEVLARTSSRSSPSRLLAAAQAAQVEGDEHGLRRLIDDVVDTIDPERVEALTALVGALPARHRVVASAVVVRRLRERGLLALLQGWPWFHLWTGLPFDEELCRDLLLSGAGGDGSGSGDSAGRDDGSGSGDSAAVDGGSGWDDEIAAAVLWLNADIAGGALLDAGEVDAFRLPAAASAALLAHAPAEDAHTALPAFLGACVKAGVGTPELLRSACTTVGREELEWPVQVMSSTAYGTLEQSMLADVLARIGFLGWRAYQSGDRDGAVTAYGLLTGLRTAGAHPSVERGRLAGLAVLGDWPAVLTRLDGDHPVLHEIALNAVRHWSVGPFTPNGYREDADVAHWLAVQLARDDQEPAVRDTLWAIKAVVEQRSSRYVAVGSGPVPSGVPGVAS